MLMFSIAGQYQCRITQRKPMEEPIVHEKTHGFSLLPALAVVVGFGLLIVSARGHVDSSVGGLITGAVALTGLVLTRQITSLSENSGLLRRTTLLADDLSRSEARFRSLVQNASDVIIVVDAGRHDCVRKPGGQARARIHPGGADRHERSRLRPPGRRREDDAGPDVGTRTRRDNSERWSSVYATPTAAGAGWK